ncbi:hypothetical protein BKA56DRAFT_350973 [Ilyonectria sp. MPI-CAGE-AT-0026]|nr:hypothetical protein BKA56DRAFT_350973 [Ilyonectria sp. MPI-CAGE-AT-0026]
MSNPNFSPHCRATFSRLCDCGEPMKLCFCKQPETRGRRCWLCPKQEPGRCKPWFIILTDEEEERLRHDPAQKGQSTLDEWMGRGKALPSNTQPGNEEITDHEPAARPSTPLPLGNRSPNVGSQSTPITSPSRQTPKKRRQLEGCDESPSKRNKGKVALKNPAGLPAGATEQPGSRNIELDLRSFEALRVALARSTSGKK